MNLLMATARWSALQRQSIRMVGCVCRVFDAAALAARGARRRSEEIFATPEAVQSRAEISSQPSFFA
jgi:hypothetical protein